MAALETRRATWNAKFQEPWTCTRKGCMVLHFNVVEKVVEIQRTKWDHERVAYYWCTYNTVGMWPGTDSLDWIEYIPEGETR